MNKIIVEENTNLDLSTLDSQLSFECSKSESSLYLHNLNSDNELSFEVLENATLYLSIFSDKALENCKITANLRKNSKIVVYFADFSVSKNKLDATINLNEEGAICEWHLASLSSNNDNKDIVVNIYHKIGRAHV